MICTGNRYISVQNREKSYTLLPSYSLLKLPIWITDSGLGYNQIGPTMLVEWKE